MLNTIPQYKIHICIINLQHCCFIYIQICVDKMSSILQSKSFSIASSCYINGKKRIRHHRSNWSVWDRWRRNFPLILNEFTGRIGERSQSSADTQIWFSSHSNCILDFLLLVYLFEIRSDNWNGKCNSNDSCDGAQRTDYLALSGNFQFKEIRCFSVFFKKFRFNKII